VVVRGLRLATAINRAPAGALARPALVMLPAAPLRWTAYRSVLEGFAGERRVVSLDWPGFGASARPAPGDFAYSVEGYAELLGPWLDALGIGRAALVGNAVGAAVGVRFALAQPERVAGLVLVAPRGFAPPGVRRTLVCRALGTPRVLVRVESLLLSLALGPANAATREILAAHRGQRGRPDEERASVAAHAALWRSFDTPEADLAAEARDVRAPAVVIRGALDPLVVAADARRAADSLGERGGLEVVLPSAGHLPFLQQPGPFMQAVRGVLHTAESA
jgi:pimeloyl-ACP methyl ester carboxylesterase